MQFLVQHLNVFFSRQFLYSQKKSKQPKKTVSVVFSPQHFILAKTSKDTNQLCYPETNDTISPLGGAASPIW